MSNERHPFGNEIENSRRVIDAFGRDVDLAHAKSTAAWRKSRAAQALAEHSMEQVDLLHHSVEQTRSDLERIDQEMTQREDGTLGAAVAVVATGILTLVGLSWVAAEMGGLEAEITRLKTEVDLLRGDMNSIQSRLGKLAKVEHLSHEVAQLRELLPTKFEAGVFREHIVETGKHLRSLEEKVQALERKEAIRQSAMTRLVEMGVLKPEDLDVQEPYSSES